MIDYLIIRVDDIIFDVNVVQISKKKLDEKYIK